MKLNFGIFNKINNAVALALELKQYLALWEDCKTLKPEFDICLESIRTPLRNLMIEFRKKVARAELTAAATKTTIDDKFVGIIANGADKAMVVFHCKDDYDKMVELDNAVKLK